MVIQVDSREKAHAITKILAEFDRKNVKWFVSKLPVGDYMNLDNPKLVIDRKQNLQEICGNVSGVPMKDENGLVKRNQDGSVQTPKARFLSELERANEYGIELIILCEHGGDIESLPDVMNWVNPRLKESPLAVSGERLFKILTAISKKYGVSFLFCDKRNTGKRIIELLANDGKEK